MTTLERIFDTLEVIATEADYIYEAIEKIDNSVPQKSQSIAEIVAAREATNRNLISFYEELLHILDWEDFDTDLEESNDDF